MDLELIIRKYRQCRIDLDPHLQLILGVSWGWLDIIEGSLKGSSSISSPLTKLTQKIVKFQWSEACEKSFHELKMWLTTGPILTLPDGTQGFVVYCDASRVGLSCVLM
ncbi:hypothetical protein MTR67_035638 [Solanum verrucosum]|uniref:Reverse transcriptase/retrotransposon-derived protein RNase H-like domain-containing protein n=1 Tax=Solanum verrucosum TaxID=315347 RepID=A0AAF0UAH5_SOLVR|nr:hypothetical protein MTR67_035638 [Solanum verrucosum]